MSIPVGCEFLDGWIKDGETAHPCVNVRVCLYSLQLVFVNLLHSNRQLAIVSNSETILGFLNLNRVLF